MVYENTIWKTPVYSLFNMLLEKFMKIAIITDDVKTICQHFGRANFYAVLTIENGQIIQREMREKLSHKHFANEAHEHTNEPGQRHGFDPASQTRHGQMSDTITDVETIDEAALAYAIGALVDHIEKLH
jgi:hypothetical protein